MVGSTFDDLKILATKRFILTFESGIVVIKHWLIHNTIRMDRFNETSYQLEKKLLKLKENKSYTEIDKEWQPNGNQMAPQVKLSKVKLSKDILSAKADEEWNFNRYLKNLLEHKRKDLSIIGIYWEYKGFGFANRKQAQSQIRRDLKAAAELTGYSLDEIKHTAKYLNKTAEFKWTLETILKYINEPNVKNYGL